MNLFINSPSYYTREYGVDSEIYAFCNHISRNIDITKYTSSLDTIGVVPIIAPKNVLNELRWKNRTHISLTYRMADISISSDFEAYDRGNLQCKKKIITDNLFESLKIVKKKLRENFDYEEMKKDIETLISEYDSR